MLLRRGRAKTMTKREKDLLHIWSWWGGVIQCGCWEELCSPYAGDKPQLNTG